MTKYLLATAAAGLISTGALAQGTGGVILTNPEFTGGFDNNGQCTAALAKVRNAQRKDPTTRGAGQDLKGAKFNKLSLTTTRCELIDGRYQVVYYANGFPT
jgi:hypothetical protein